jgi:hypothetical protein
MSISSETRKSLRRLASLAVRESDPLDPASIANSGFRQGPVPAHLREEGDTEEYALTMYGDEYRAFNETLRFLVDEPRLEHLQPGEIDSSLWDLICELSLDRSAFNNPQRRSARLQSYLETIARPHTPFHVVVPIENLRVEAPIDVAGVRIEHWESEQANEWAIRRGADLTEHFVDRTVAIVLVKAGRADRAVRRARVLAEQALDRLRFGFANSIRVRVRDNEAMFRQSEMHAVREEGGARSHGWDLRFQPYETPLSPTRISRIAEYLEPVERLTSNENLVPALRKRFSLALHWLSTAMTRTDYDEKVVDICTALESLLTQRSDRRKGELIALRAMLLQCALDGRFTDTFRLLQLYELRSQIVHGSDIDLCGEGQYTYLFDTTTRLVMQAVDLVNRDPAIRSFKHFRNAIESKDLLEVAMRWFNRYGRHGQPIVAQANKLLSAGHH